MLLICIVALLDLIINDKKICVGNFCLMSSIQDMIRIKVRDKIGEGLGRTLQIGRAHV